MIDLSVDIAGIRMKTPIIPASGTFDPEESAQIEGFNSNKIGAIISKGTTYEPRHGNPQPRTVEVSSGMINFIGLQNPGVHEFASHKLVRMRKFKVPIIVNVSGREVSDYVKVIEVLNAFEWVVAYEINISCPNVSAGGMAFGQDPILAAKVVSAVRSTTKKPLITKLTPNVTSTVPIARAVIEAGANAISAINTVRGRKKIWNSPNRGQYVQGGLSGPCIMPIALAIINDLAKANLGVPIIGGGGICNVFDVVEFLENGAVAVQVGTANFPNPLVMMELTRDLGTYIEKAGCKSLVGWREKGFPMPSEKDFPHFTLGR